MALGTVLCMVFPEMLMGLFSENPQTVAQGAKALRIISCGFVVTEVLAAAASLIMLKRSRIL